MGMKNNISVTDRRIRIVVGLVVGLIGLATLGDFLAFGVTVGVALSVVALILIGTGLIRVCPLYRLLGVDTSRP